MQKKNVNPHFDIGKLDSLPKVEIVYMYVDASGRVTQFNQVFDDKKLGTIAADSHNPQKARILLMLALNNYQRPKHNTGNVSEFLMSFKN